LILKKFLLLSLAIAGIAGVAGATPVSCGVLMTPNSSNILISATCTITPDAGFFISALTLTGTDDFTGGSGFNGTPGTGPIVDYSGVLSQSVAVFGAPGFCEVTSTGNNSNPCALTINPSSTVTGLNLGTNTSYTLSIATASNTVVQGAISGASINLFLDYAETAASVGPTPEPATLGLMGTALVGLAFMARKKKK
jgi:hypothetical protein